MFTNRESAAFLRVRRSSSRTASIRALALVAGLACASTALAQPGVKDDPTKSPAPAPRMSQPSRSELPRTQPAPREVRPTPSKAPSSESLPRIRPQPSPAPSQGSLPRAQPAAPAAQPKEAPKATPPTPPAPRAVPTRPAEPPTRTAEPPRKTTPVETKPTPAPSVKPSKPSGGDQPSRIVPGSDGRKVVDVKPRVTPRDVPAAPGGGLKPAPGPGTNPVRPGNPSGGFKPVAPAPREDLRGRDRPGGSNFIPAAPAPAETTRRVSDRADRFSHVNNAAPVDRGFQADRRRGWSGHNDHDSYWDGYRDGYRRGYRNGWRDGFWDDCWAPSWRRHSYFALGFSSGCWSGWSLSIGWGSPYYGCYTPAYYAPPSWYYYRPLVSYSTVSTTTWDGSTTVTTTYYNSAPRLEVVDFCDEICAPTTIVYQPVTRTVVASGPRVVNVDLPDFQPTIYRSGELAGILGWNDTPETVAAAVGSTGTADRPNAAAQFLGRIPAGAWDVGYEGERIVEGQRELHFRGLSPNGRGQRVLVVLVPKSPTPSLYPGQRVQITGRVAEICVDDPFEQAGRITLADGAVRN